MDTSSHHHLSFFLFLGLLISALGGPTCAQTIQGQLLDRDTGEGVEGALVLLLDREGNEVDGFLSNEAGRFLIRAQNPGTYTLRAERIGYETVTSEPIVLASTQIFGIRLQTGQSAIELEGIQVRGEQQCVIRPAEGLELSRVWDEARKALTAQEWAEGEGLYRFRLVRYERVLDPESGAVRSEERKGIEVVNRNPIHSLPAQELLENGFVQTREDGAKVYYGPDASVLLSDRFLDTHCFRLSTSEDFPTLLGLSFEPVETRDIPDIVGTLWLDRATAELVRLDYTYDWAPWEEVRGVAEGRVEFQRIPTGAWIVRKWWIRMPAVGQVRQASSGWPTLKLVEIREVGSEVARVTSMNRQVLSREDPRPKGRLRGVAWDSLRSRPLSDATVYLSGTQYDARTESTGRFFMEGIPEGRYVLAVSSPALDSLGIMPGRVEVRISPQETNEVQVGLPSRSTLLDSLCGVGKWQVGDAFVTGTVQSDEGGSQAAGATVTLEWSRYKIDAGGAYVGKVTREIQAVTDARGRFRVCGIPADVKITAQAWMEDPREHGPPLEVAVAKNAVVLLDLIIPTPRGRPGPLPPNRP